MRKKPGDVTTSYILWKFHPKSRGPHRGQTVEHMAADIPRKNHVGAFLQAQDGLYMVLPDGIELGKADIHIARNFRNEILFTGHHVLVEGFTIELSAALRVSPPPAGHFVFRLLKSYSHRYKGSVDTTLQIGTHGLLEDSTFVLNSCWDWHTGELARDGEYVKKLKHRWGDIRRAWFQVKAGYNDSYTVNAMSHSVLRYNSFYGHVNALHVRTKSKISAHRNIDIHNNLVVNAGDDAIEPEGPAVNMRIYENKLSLFLNGVSDAPCRIGPVFIVRNIFHRFMQGAFKVKNGADGQALYYHNVCYPNMKDLKLCSNTPDGGTACAPSTTDGVRWMRTRNNILIGRRRPMHLNKKRFPLVKIASLDYDYNCLWGMTGKKYKTMLPEPHSVWGLPKFIDTEKGDLRIIDDKQPGVDVGAVIKGINDEVPAPYQFKGKGPDMGLYEAGSPLPHYGPRAK
ncbi:hypothetical protein ACFL6F_02740 [Planctomycetota bacterium]